MTLDGRPGAVLQLFHLADRGAQDAATAKSQRTGAREIALVRERRRRYDADAEEEEDE